MTQFNQKLAVFLAECSLFTYIQYLQNGYFPVPKNFKLVKAFKASAFGKKEWFGFIMESKEAIVIAFRGTRSTLDWVYDAEFFQTNYLYAENAGLVHDGFQSIYESVREIIIRILNKLSPKKHLYITGHSLGAALAVLHGLDAAENTRFNNLTLYNFAGPRVGDEQFSRQYNKKVKNSIRVVNRYDIVPMLPPPEIYCPFTEEIWSYRHVHSPFYFSVQTGSIGGNHSINTYLNAMKNLKITL